MRTIRWGIIGCGDVTEKKSGPGFQKASNSELVAVMRRNSAAAEDYAKRHNVSEWYDDADKIINHPDIDIVYIATPPGSHEMYTLRCAAAGKPVYVEKPMSRNPTESQRMIDACKTAGVPLYVAYYRRSLPMFLKVKELIDSDAIGEVRTVNMTKYWPIETEDQSTTPPWRVDPEIAGAGRFLDIASHAFDFLDFVFGPIADATGHAANQGGFYKAEDVVTASYRFECGIQGSGTWCFTGPECADVDRIEILGTKGMLTFSCFQHDNPLRVRTSHAAEEFYFDELPHIQQPFIQTIVDEMNGIGVCPSTGETGIRTDYVMDSILKGWRGS